MLAGVTDTLLANRPVDGAAGNGAQSIGDADLDDVRVIDPGLDDLDFGGLD
jgi:hypothetical protein